MISWKCLKTKIVLLLFLPPVTTAVVLVAVSPLKQIHNHIVLLSLAVVIGTASCILSARWLIRLVAESQRLQEQQLNFLQTLMDTIPNPIYFKDRSGKYLGCNSAFETATGVDRKEIVGRLANDFFVAEMADIYCQGDEELFAKGGAQVFGIKVPYADGSLHQVVFHKGTFTRVDGSLGGLVGIYTDITDQKNAQIALLREKNFTAALLQGSATPTFVLDREHQVIIWNRACETLTGLPAADVVGTDMHWKGFYPEKRICLADIVLDHNLTGSDWQDKYDNSSISQKRVQGEGWFRFNDRRRYLCFSAAPIYGDAGEIVAAVETLEDITDRKLLEDELGKLTYAVTQSPVGILITDRKGIVEYVNPRFTEITGYSLDEVHGTDSASFRWGDASTSVYNELLSTLQEGKEWRGRFHNRRKNGELYWEDALIGPIKDNDGNITHFIAMKEDVTGRVRLEEQLQYSQKMDSIGRMAGGLAHDFNNILTAIAGYVGIMEFQLEENSPLLPALGQIRTSVDRAASLTSGLLDFSREQRTNPLPVNLNEIVKRVGSLVTSLTGEDITIHNSLSEAPLEIMADSVQIEQIIMQLVSNARDAMPNGGELWIGTRRTKLDQEFIRRYGYGVVGDYALLTITDNGAGMDAETLEMIYEPFFTTKSVGKGTGLGLAVVYGSVKQLKGYLTCYSEPGKGSQFNIFLPLNEQNRENDKEDSVYYVKPVDRSSFSGMETILVVEDDNGVLQIITGLLEEFGYRVLTAADGNKALAVFSEKSAEISLVILDAIMPEKTGWDTYREMRATVPQIKAVFTSGYNRESLLGKGMLEEDSQFIPKPIAPLELLRSVREALDK